MTIAHRILQSAGLLLRWLLGCLILPLYMLPGLWAGLRDIWTTTKGTQWPSN